MRTRRKVTKRYEDVVVAEVEEGERVVRRRLRHQTRRIRVRFDRFDKSEPRRFNWARFAIVTGAGA